MKEIFLSKISFKNENKSHSSNCEDLEPLLKQIDGFHLLESESNNIRDEKNLFQISNENLLDSEFILPSEDSKIKEMDFFYSEKNFEVFDTTCESEKTYKSCFENMHKFLPDKIDNIQFEILDKITEQMFPFNNETKKNEKNYGIPRCIAVKIFI